MEVDTATLIATNALLVQLVQQLQAANARLVEDHTRLYDRATAYDRLKLDYDSLVQVTNDAIPGSTTLMRVVLDLLNRHHAGSTATTNTQVAVACEELIELAEDVSLLVRFQPAHDKHLLNAADFFHGKL